MQSRGRNNERDLASKVVLWPPHVVRECVHLSTLSNKNQSRKRTQQVSTSHPPLHGLQCAILHSLQLLMTADRGSFSAKADNRYSTPLLSPTP